MICANCPTTLVFLSSVPSVEDSDPKPFLRGSCSNQICKQLSPKLGLLGSASPTISAMVKTPQKGLRIGLPGLHVYMVSILNLNSIASGVYYVFACLDHDGRSANLLPAYVAWTRRRINASTPTTTG